MGHHWLHMMRGETLGPHSAGTDWRRQELSEASLLENSISLLFFSLIQNPGFICSRLHVPREIHGKTITYSSVMSSVESSSQPATQHIVWNLLYIKPSVKSFWKIPRKRAVVSDEGKIQHRTHQPPLIKQCAANNTKAHGRDEGCHCIERHLRTSTLMFHAWTLFG